VAGGKVPFRCLVSSMFFQLTSTRSFLLSLPLIKTHYVYVYVLKETPKSLAILDGVHCVSNASDENVSPDEKHTIHR
jgi:hypothetical protein